MAKQKPKTKTYKLNKRSSDVFYRSKLKGYRNVDGVSLCGTALEQLFSGLERRVELVVSNVRPAGDNFHFIRLRDGDWFVPNIGGTLYVPWAARCALSEDFPDTKTLYLWCY